MSTLPEIESAIEHLCSQELQILEGLLHALRRRRSAEGGCAARFSSDFSGIIRLEQDPLAWQRQMRDEWG